MSYDDFGDREAAQENATQATTLELKDFRGTPIVAGSVIVYPGRQSSSLWMTEAVVKEVATRQTWRKEVPVLLVQPTFTTGYRDTPDAKNVVIERIERVVVVPPRKEA